MNRGAISLVVLLAGPGLGHAQVGGNAVVAPAPGNAAYGQAVGKAGAEWNERAKRNLGPRDVPPPGSTFVEASVLMNVKADEYVAVFGVSEEAPTVAECGKKVDATIKEFTDALKALGVAADDLFVDFIAQNRIYGFEVAGDIAREKLVGFELKKNVSIRYRDRDKVDAFVQAAARSRIYDLIKVDYVVKDLEKVQARLMDEAARVVKEKSARYDKLLGVKLRPPGQVIAERPSTYYPTRMYDTYTAFEAETIGYAERQKLNVQSARKSRTFYYNALDGDGFDAVVDPVVLEPVVQFTLYLKVKYEVEPIQAK
jgi:uncharacterized protein YggE